MKRNRTEGLIESVKDIFKALISGDILRRLGVYKLMPAIIFVFALGWINILLSFKVDIR